jgi:hypothetical protein
MESRDGCVLRIECKGKSKNNYNEMYRETKNLTHHILFVSRLKFLPRAVLFIIQLHAF